MSAVEPYVEDSVSVAAQALEAIHEEHGHITAVLVVETARDATHPLHSFIWDMSDADAAYQYRLDRARTVIRAVRVRREVGDRVLSLRRYRSIASEAGPRVYEDIDEIRTDPVSRELLLREMRRDVLALRQRYADHATYLQAVIDEILNGQG